VTDHNADSGNHIWYVVRTCCKKAGLESARSCATTAAVNLSRFSFCWGMYWIFPSHSRMGSGTLLGPYLELTDTHEISELEKIWLNLADRVSVTENMEGLFQVNVFPSKDGSGTLVGNLSQQVRVCPGDQSSITTGCIFRKLCQDG